MSLNHLVLSPQLNLECKDLSFGSGQLKTKEYAPVIQISNGNIINTTSNFIYQCDDVSLRIKGWVNFTSAVTPQNNFNIILSLPLELQSRFSSGNIFSTGVLSEYPFNTNTNAGNVVYAEYDLDGNINNTVFYRQNQETAIGFRVNLDIVIYSVIV
jgi:hypothetical protein